MKEDLEFYRDLTDEEKQKYRVTEKSRRELIVTYCRHCGQQKIVYTRIYEPSFGYGDHAHHYDVKFICGGKSQDGKWLCETCISLSARIDYLDKLEHQIDEAQSTLKETTERVEELIKWLKEK